MKISSLFTGDLEQDWLRLGELWTKPGIVLGSEVGPTWEMPPQHEACIVFAERYPDSKRFLIKKLSEPDAVVAAYAFKCLIRIADIRPADIPEIAISRQDAITTLFHSRQETKTLADFMTEYFESFSSRTELLEDQEKSLSWQRNELAKYKNATNEEEGRS
jgi:hypothetical protein